MSAIDTVNRIYREFKRYTGDGLPGAPTGAPLPVGDPQSGPYNPKKSDLRAMLIEVLTSMGMSLEEATEQADRAQQEADRAAGYAAAVGAAGGLLTRPTVAALLADTVLSYTAGEDLTEVGAGDIVEAQGFRYEVAASAATDHHVVTAGAVKLYVLAGENGLNVLAFGAIGDGVADDTGPIQKAAHALKDAFPNWYGSTSLNGPAALFFPRGLFRITDTIALPRGILVHGLNARNNGGSQIYQETANKWVFDLYGYEFSTGDGDTRREADQQILGLFFRSAGGGIRMDRRDHPGADGYSTGSSRVKDCYFLDINGGANYAAIWAERMEEVSGCTFDYMQSPAFRGRSCYAFTNNSCWGGYVSDPSFGNDFAAKSIISNNEMNAGDGSNSALGGCIVHLGGGSTVGDILYSNNFFTKIPSGPGGFGVLISGGLNSLVASNNTYKDMTYPAIVSVGQTVTLKLSNELFENVSGVGVSSAAVLGEVFSGSISNCTFQLCNTTASTLSASAVTSVSILDNDFNGNTRVGSDIAISAAARTRITGNRNKSTDLLVTVGSIDDTCEVQGKEISITGTTDGFVSNYTVVREDGLLFFSGFILRSTAGTFAKNTFNAIGVLSNLVAPRGEMMCRILVDGSQQRLLPVFCGADGILTLGVVWDDPAGLAWTSSLRIEFMAQAVRPRHRAG